MEEEYILELPICRVCLKTSDECIEMETLMFDEHNGEEASKTYYECLKACTQLEFQIDDGQPNHICCTCCNELTAAYEFIKKAKISHDILTLETFQVVKCESPTNDEDIENKSQNESQTNNDEYTENEEDNCYFPVTQNDMDEQVEVVSSNTDTKYNEDCESSSKISEQDMQVLEEFSIDDYRDEEIIQYEEVSDSKCRCNMCYKYFPNLNALKEHGEQDHAEAAYWCDICYHRFAFRYSLKEHMRRKHDTSIVKCNICQILIESNLLQTHKRKEHRNQIFLCAACPRTFKTSTGLHVHSETHKENRQRQFQCEKCDKKFLTEKTFKVHAQTHWERQRFKCDLCDKEFMQKVNLKLHMQMHTGETMDCAYCQKKFVRKNDLTVHMRFHTGNFPYECSLCDKRFAIISHLNYHKKRHQGLVYKCDVCDKEFINKSGLRNHSFQHTEMPFSCMLCGKGFPTKFKIKRHLKSVHHIEENEDFESLITTDKMKNKIFKAETLDEEILEQIVEEQSILDGEELV